MRILQRFYRDVFGWQIEMDVENGPALATFEDPEGHMIGLIKAGTGFYSISFIRSNIFFNVPMLRTVVS